MQAQIRGIAQAKRNVQDATNLLRVADAGMKEVQNMVQRIRELTAYAANDTNTIEDRQHIQEEINQLVEEIDLISYRTQYNGRTLLTGRYAKPLLYDATSVSIAPLQANHQLGMVPMPNAFSAAQVQANKQFSMVQDASDAAQIAPFSGTHSLARVLPGTSAAREININQLHNNATTYHGDGWWFDWSASQGRGTVRITDSTTDGGGAFHIIGAGSGPAINTAIVLTENAGLEVDLILQDVNINSNFNSALRAVGSDLNLHLVGDNTLRSSRSSGSSAGIFSQAGHLRIYGTDDDTLYARGTGHSAGIGSFRNGNNADNSITILGGNITAQGGTGQAAAIGGEFASSGTINILGGIVRATSTWQGAAIGSGRFGTGGEITISGNAYVRATSTGNGAAIGGGLDANSGIIRIEGGTVHAAARDGAAIGGGTHGSASALETIVYITGGIVTATSTGGGAAIGTGASGGNNHSTRITIGGDAHVTARGSTSSAGIGGGVRRPSGTIIIEGNATVYATGDTGIVWCGRWCW